MGSFFIGVYHLRPVVSSPWSAACSYPLDKIILDFPGFLTGICRDINPFVFFFINPVVYEKTRFDILTYAYVPFVRKTSACLNMFRYFFNNFVFIHRDSLFLFVFLFFIHGYALQPTERLKKDNPGRFLD